MRGVHPDEHLLKEGVHTVRVNSVLTLNREHWPRSRATDTHRTTPIRHAVMHCQGTLRGTIDQTCARSTASGLAVSVAGLQACAATCARRHESHKHFCGACLAPARRVGSEHVDLGRTSTPELACDAGTPGTLSAGDLGGCGKLAHLLFSCSSAASQRDLQILTPVYLSCSAT